MRTTPRVFAACVAGLAAALLGASACGGTVVIRGNDGGGSDAGQSGGDAGSVDSGSGRDGGNQSGGDAGTDAGSDAGQPQDTCSVASDGGCYSIVCSFGVQTLQQNRDRLVADLARRMCTNSCTLWASLNLAERYIFLMDTAYFGDPTSRLYPPGAGKLDTALDHAVALYSINGPKAGQGVDGSGRGGNDYNRVYLSFDPLGECVMRNFSIANPNQTSGYNMWVTSDDLAGPHAPFTQREMIYWYKGTFDLQSNGPQFHHWHKDSDFSQSGINARLGVCGNTDRSLTESTIAFDFYHNSDPLGDYATRGGYGWQIVDQHTTIDAGWNYMPTGCPVSAPVNTDPYGGGTFNGMGPVQSGSTCTRPVLGDAGC